MRTFTQILIAAAFCAAAGCGGIDETSQEQQNRAPQYMLDAALRAKVDSARAQALADTCFLQQQDTSQCDWGEFPYDPAQFALQNSTNEAVLIVDEFPELPPRAIRYKNRIKGFYRADAEGAIAAVSFAWRAPTRLFGILSSFASPDVIPAYALRSLHEPLDRVYGSYGASNAGHGSYVFGLLAEANPLQPLVVLDRPELSHLAPAEFCEPTGTPESSRVLQAKSQRVAAELRRLMRELNVRFVNLSAGPTLAALRDEWRSRCTGAPPEAEVLRRKLAAYAPILDAIFNTPGVFAAHASIDATDPSDFPFDFPSAAYPNRMRVGYIATLDSKLDTRGRGDHDGLASWPNRANVDIYLNSGVIPKRPYAYNQTPLLQLDDFGVGVLPISNTTTSWITTLALSRFINIRYSSEAGTALTNERIATIKERMTPAVCSDLPDRTCVFQDPMRHGQIEGVRLGYVPPEYDE